MNAECQNCDWSGAIESCKPVQRLHERVAPGEPMPAGECPKCGALCQPVENEDVIRVLVASTSNLPVRLAHRMNEGMDVGVVYEHRIEYGWLVRYWTRRKSEWLKIPIPMKRVIEAAEAKGCTMILFDCDATPVAGLPTWNW